LNVLTALCSCFRGPPRATTIKPEDAVPLFFGDGLQYYVAGRSAFFAGCNSVAANLLHHAVEMCLKGGLSKAGLTLTELTKLRHHLPKIWKKFKQQTGVTKLNQLDGVVAALHKYEELRYPDTVLQRGMLSGFILHKPTPSTSTQWSGKEPQYELCLEAVDELIEAIFTSASINLGFFPLSQEAKEHVNKENLWVHL
jgi:hypothetical protein